MEESIIKKIEDSQILVKSLNFRKFQKNYVVKSIFHKTENCGFRNVLKKYL